MRGFSGRRASLLVTVALATLGAACKSKDSPSRDAAASPDVGAGAEAGVDAAVDAAPPDTALDAMGDRAAPVDVAADLAPDAPRDVSVPDMSTLDAAAANPRRLWFSGPEDSIHLAETEPDTPF
jgi:hypothetical protein